MRTRMHQEAFPGEDISDRPEPEESVPAILILVDGDRPSGRLPRERPDQGGRVSAIEAPELAPHAAALEPPEARGLRRDDVRMLVAHRADGWLVHARFRDLPELLADGRPARREHLGDAAGRASRRAGGRRAGGTPPLDRGARGPARRALAVASSSCDARGGALRRWRRGRATEACRDGASARLLAPYLGGAAPVGGRARAPRAPRRITSPATGDQSPIRTCAASARSPTYQTAFALHPGSAEMPSAGRAFTPELVTPLIARGIALAPVTLHTGVSSLESHEAPVPRALRRAGLNRAASSTRPALAAGG